MRVNSVALGLSQCPHGGARRGARRGTRRVCTEGVRGGSPHCKACVEWRPLCGHSMSSKWSHVLTPYRYCDKRKATEFTLVHPGNLRSGENGHEQATSYVCNQKSRNALSSLHLLMVRDHVRRNHLSNHDARVSRQLQLHAIRVLVFQVQKSFYAEFQYSREQPGSTHCFPHRNLPSMDAVAHCSALRLVRSAERARTANRSWCPCRVQRNANSVA